jgi:hypothetical protein
MVGATMIEAAVMAAVEEAAVEEAMAGMIFELFFCDIRLMRACLVLTHYFFCMALDTTIADVVDTKNSRFSRAVRSRLLAHLPAFLVLAQFVALGSRRYQ